MVHISLPRLAAVAADGSWAIVDPDDLAQGEDSGVLENPMLNPISMLVRGRLFSRVCGSQHSLCLALQFPA